MAFLQTFTTLFRDHLYSRAGEKDDGTLFDEVSFSRALAEEDRRARRGGRPYLLMLIEIGTLKDGMERNRAISCIASVLRTSTRETDIKGWAGGQDVMGVLFTEVNASVEGLHEALAAITQRIWSDLASVLKDQPLEKIVLSFPLDAVSTQSDQHRAEAGMDSLSMGKGLSFQPELRKAG